MKRTKKTHAQSDSSASESEHSDRAATQSESEYADYDRADEHEATLDSHSADIPNDDDDQDNNNNVNNINISGLSNSELSKAAFPVFDDVEYSQFNAHDVYLDTSYFFSNGFVKLPTVKQHYPSNKVETVIDALQEYILGIDGGPALQDLDRKYKQLWRTSYTMDHKQAYMVRRDVAERFVKLVVEDGLTNAQAIETLERIQDGTALLRLQESLQTIAQSNVGRPAFPGGPSPYACFKAGEFDPPRKGAPSAAVRKRPDRHEIPIVRLDERPKGVRDILLSWRFGFNGKPAIQDLYRQYDHYWKHPKDETRFYQHTAVVTKFLDLVLNKRFTEETAIRRLEGKQKSDSLGVLRKKLLTKTVVEKNKLESEKRKKQRALAKKQKEKEKKEDAKRKKQGLPKLNRNIQVAETIQDDGNKDEEADDNDPDSEKNSPYYPYTRFRAEEFKILGDDEARNKKEWEAPDALVSRLCNEVWTVAEALQEWRFGLRGGQAIQDLDCKYGRRWRVVSDKQKYKCRRTVVQTYVRLVLDSKLSNKKAIMWMEALRGTKTLEGLQAAISSTSLPVPPLETSTNQQEQEESDTDSNSSSDTDSQGESDDESDEERESHADAQKGAKHKKGQTDHSESEDEASENGNEENNHLRDSRLKKESANIADSDSENTEDSDGDHLADAPKGSKRMRKESMAHSDDSSDEESRKVESRDSKRSRDDIFVSAHRRHHFEEEGSDSDDSSPESYEKRLYRRHKSHRNIWRNRSDRRQRQDGGKGPLNWPAVPAFFIGTSGYHVKSITKVPYPVRFVSSFKELWDEWKVGWKGEPSIESLVRPLGEPLIPRLKWERKAYRIIRLKKVIVLAIEYVVSAGVVNSAEEAINILDDARGIMHPLGFVLREDCRELFTRWGVPKVLFYHDHQT